MNVATLPCDVNEKCTETKMHCSDAATSSEAQALEFLHTLWPQLPHRHTFALWIKGHSKGDHKTIPYGPETLDKAAALTAKYAESDLQKQVYFHLGASAEPIREGGRFNAEEVGAIPGFWADIDVGEGAAANHAEALAFACSMPLKPSIIVASGSGGCHAYWLFQRPWIFADREEHDAAAKLSKGWLRLVQAKSSEWGWTKADQVYDLARLLRMPGSTNLNGPEPRPVKIIPGSNSGHRYTREQFREAIEAAGIDLNALDKPGSAAAAPTTSLAAGNGQIKAMDKDRIQAFLDLEDDTFTSLWNLRRPWLKQDGQTPDWSSYDAGLASWALHAGLQENDAAALLVSFREAHCQTDADRAKAQRRDYLERTLQRAKQGVPAQDQGQGDDEAGEICLTPADVLEHARQAASADDVPVVLDEIVAAGLTETQAEQALKALKDATGTPMGALRRDLAQERKEAQQQRQQAAAPDLEELHVKAADRVIADIGAENIITKDERVYLWSGTHWRQAVDREVKQRILDVLKLEAIKKSNVDSIFDVLMTRTTRPGHKFDINTDFVNVLNGELHLAEGAWQLRPHDKRNYRTSVLPVEWSEAATAPRFTDYLESIFAGDSDKAEKKQLLLELTGYACTARADFETALILHGPGANGKSVYCKVLQSLVGEDNCSAISPRHFAKNFQVVNLKSKLVNLTPEMGQNEKLPADRVKAISSGDLIEADEKYKPTTKFRPYSTLVMACNALPSVDDTSAAMRRRMKILEFNRVFSREQQNRGLHKELEQELPGILRMALEAFAGVVERGDFEAAPSVDAAVASWLADNDPVGQFIEEEVIADPDAKESVQVTYDVFIRFAREKCLRMVPKNAFARQLNRAGFSTTVDKSKDRKSVKHFNEMRLARLVMDPELGVRVQPELVETEDD